MKPIPVIAIGPRTAARHHAWGVRVWKRLALYPECCWQVLFTWGPSDGFWFPRYEP